MDFIRQRSRPYDLIGPDVHDCVEVASIAHTTSPHAYPNRTTSCTLYFSSSLERSPSTVHAFLLYCSAMSRLSSEALLKGGKKHVVIVGAGAAGMVRVWKYLSVV